MQSQTILFSEPIGDQQSENHGQQPQHPQVAVRDLLDVQHPPLHLAGKSEVGEAFNNKQKAQQTKQQPHLHTTRSLVIASLVSLVFACDFRTKL